MAVAVAQATFLASATARLIRRSSFLTASSACLPDPQSNCSSHPICWRTRPLI